MCCHCRFDKVTGTMTDIGSTMGRISMIYLRRACRCSQLTDIERAEIGVDARKLAVLAGLWTFYLVGGLIGIYVENIVAGPKALLVPAFVTGSVGVTYMACRQLLKDYIKKVEKAREVLSNASCMLARYTFGSISPVFSMVFCLCFVSLIFLPLLQERFSADLKEAQSALAHMGSRLQDLETGDTDLASWPEVAACVLKSLSLFLALSLSL